MNVFQTAGAVLRCVLALQLAAIAGAQCIEQQLLPESPAPNGQFGREIAIDGDQMIIGEVALTTFLGLGSAHYYQRVNGTWSFVSDVPNPTPPAVDGFGVAIALEGDTAVIGAPGIDSAFVFRRNGSSWALEQALDSGGLDYFGISVALEGDTLAVSNSESLRIFARAGTTWLLEQELIGPDVAFQVVLDGGQLFASTREDRIDVYSKTEGNWTVASSIEPDAPSNFSDFGLRFDAEGGRLVTSANGAQAGLNGALFFFERSGVVWTQEHLIESPGFTGISSAAISGDRALARHPNREIWVYQRSGPEWYREARFVPDSASENQYGQDVAIDGNTGAIGATGDDHSGFISPGSVFVLELPPVPANTTGTEFCFSTPGSTCSSCPCANDVPSVAESGCGNLSGIGCRLFATGSPVIANDTLEFNVVGATPNSGALLISADSALPLMGACPQGSGIATSQLDGLRCAGVNLIRHGVRPTNGCGSNQSAWTGLIGNLGMAIGQTRSFQVFYRDLGTGVCGTGVNTSNAVSITAEP